MTGQRVLRLYLVAGLAPLVAWCGVSAAMAAPAVPEDGSDGIQVLARGPVHEAFAETVTFDPEPGIIVAKAPPDSIEELPPEHKPEGVNVAWIPGYWAWDDDSNDFLWVSGIWRALPPGRQWVPGYWAESGKGAQWISGYWADAQLTEAEYLPEPPETVEAGPNTAAPSEDYSWLPGSWVWQQNRYVWRPGFWTTVYPNWTWIPAHYVWAPRGYVYVDGYWDYAVDRRGVLFAPVSFDQSVYSQRGFSYTPSTVIDLGVFASHLFLRPNYGHYYYGDYYGTNYTTAGIYPSYKYENGRRGYDPIYSHQRWSHRQDRDWSRRVQTEFEHRREHEDARPPRTFRAQQELYRKGVTAQDKGRVYAQPLERYTTAKDSPMRFQPVNKDDRQRFGRLGHEVRKSREERQRLEAKTVDPVAERPARTGEPARVKLPRSPIVAKRPEELGKDFAPPKSHEFPKPDPKVVPRARQPIVHGRTPRPEPQPMPGVEQKQPTKVDPRPQPQPVVPRAQPPKTQPPRNQPPKTVPNPTSPKGGPPAKPKPGPKESPRMS